MPQDADWIRRIHGNLVHGRRLEVLAQAIVSLLEPGWRVLDVGCGDGRLGRRLVELCDGLSVQGYEVSVRPQTAIPVRAFDGRSLPVADGGVEAVLLIDVLHHTVDPRLLLAEAARVASRAVIVKDHRMGRPLAGPTLRFMDWVGNRGHGVALPYDYWCESRWRAEWRELGLVVEHYQPRLRLYPWPASWLFGNGLHFVARLVPRRTCKGTGRE